jgi:hypothetical protein
MHVVGHQAIRMQAAIGAPQQAIEMEQVESAVFIPEEKLVSA